MGFVYKFCCTVSEQLRLAQRLGYVLLTRLLFSAAFNVTYKQLLPIIFNPRRTWAVRVTVVGLCVCVFVSVSRPLIRYSRNYKTM